MGSRTTFTYPCDSNGSSSICYFPKTENLSSDNSYPDIPAPRCPIENMRSFLDSPDFYSPSDARIVVEVNREIPVHSNILCAKSPFFKNLFYGVFGQGRCEKLEMKVLAKDFDVGYDSLVAVLEYLYTGKLRPLPEGVCTCVDEDCEHIGCRPKVNFMVEVLYASFIFQIPEFVSLYQRNIIGILDKVAIDDILVILFVANICSIACPNLLEMCMENVIKSGIDVITLEKALPQSIVKRILGSRVASGLPELGNGGFLDENVKSMHRALDNGDFYLVKKLLNWGHTNVDNAYALHYAVAYCDVKTIMWLLDQRFADVNRRNPRGYSVLHVAAIRKEPKVIESLLKNGARLYDLTLDGRKALQISKRLTRFVEGKMPSKDQLCVQILEEAERRDCLAGETFLSLSLAGNQQCPA